MDIVEDEMSKMLAKALRRRPPSVDLESRLVLGLGESSLSAMDDAGIQKELDVTPDERREEVDVRLDCTDGACVDIDSLGRMLLSPLEVVEVDIRLARPEIMEPKRIAGSGLSTPPDADLSGRIGRTVRDMREETVVSFKGDPVELMDPTSQDSPLEAGESLPLVELFARRLLMVAVGDSLRAQPPIRAMERTERIARMAREPDLGCELSSTSKSGRGVPDLDAGRAVDIALLST